MGQGIPCEEAALENGFSARGCFKSAELSRLRGVYLFISIDLTYLYPTLQLKYCPPRGGFQRREDETIKRDSKNLGLMTFKKWHAC